MKYGKLLIPPLYNSDIPQERWDTIFGKKTLPGSALDQAEKRELREMNADIRETPAIDAKIIQQDKDLADLIEKGGL